MLMSYLPSVLQNSSSLIISICSYFLTTSSLIITFNCSSVFPERLLTILCVSTKCHLQAGQWAGVVISASKTWFYLNVRIFLCLSNSVQCRCWIIFGGDTDAQGSVCDARTSFRGAATRLWAEQWRCSFILELKEVVRGRIRFLYSEEWGGAFFFYCCGCCWRLTWWLAQRLMPGQVHFKLEDIAVPGRPREPKDTNMISTSVSLHCGALKTLTLLDPHMLRCQGADQLGPECCCPS